MTLVSNKGYGAGAGSAELPPHKFGPHDVVAVRPSRGPADGPPLVSGVVYRVRETAIIVAVDEAPEEGMDQPLRLDKLANEVTYQRMRGTLESLLRVQNGNASTPDGRPLPGGAVLEVAFGRRDGRFSHPQPTWTAINSGLDESQRAAISLALASQDMALVHGPPGKG
jgi:ATP-dependent RNA/DNA helicase IGHMBP2